jgi:transcriptional regulator GlxA family with amidase domain
MFDLAVVDEAFGPHRSTPGAPDFELLRTAAAPGEVALARGAAVRADHGFAALARADLVLVPGRDEPTAPVPPVLAGALVQARANGATVAALCSGAFTLAHAGLLDGREAVTHWGLVEEFRALFPAVRIRADVLFTHADGIATSAGVAAGIDLCLELIRGAHGAGSAAQVARAMVTAPFRTGHQAQFITPPPPRGGTMSQVMQRALADLAQPLTVALMARWAHQSERTFSRRFREQVGVPPMAWVLAQRLAAAQRLLEHTDDAVTAVADRAGFGSAVMMRQHFVTHLGTTPSLYRRQFRARRAGQAPAS